MERVRGRISFFMRPWGTASPSNVVVKPFTHPNPSYNPSLPAAAVLYLPTNSVPPLIPKNNNADDSRILHMHTHTRSGNM